MCSAPSHSSIPALHPTTTALKSGLRRTASRGREIASDALCHALANKLPVAPLRYSTPRFAVHSFSPPFLWLQSPPLRTGSSSPHIASFNPDKSGERCSRALSKSTLRILTRTAAILPRNRLGLARSVGVRLHITLGAERSERKRCSARWGVCDATTGASPRKPPTRSFFAR